MITMGLTALIGGIILTVKGNKLEGKSKKRVFGIVLLVMSAMVLIPVGIGVYKVFMMYFA